MSMGSIMAISTIFLPAIEASKFQEGPQLQHEMTADDIDDQLPNKKNKKVDQFMGANHVVAHHLSRGKLISPLIVSAAVAARVFTPRFDSEKDVIENYIMT